MIIPPVSKQESAKLKNNLAAGPDSLPPILFKKLGSCLSEPPSIMFTSLFSIGQMPNEWRKSIVAPVYKNGLSSQATNYRPIALTSVACKLM